MENTDDKINETAFKKFQELALQEGDLVVERENKMTPYAVYGVTMRCLYNTKFHFVYKYGKGLAYVEAEEIWRAIIIYEKLNFCHLMDFAFNYWQFGDYIQKLFLERYPTEALANDYILRTKGDITFKDSFYEKNFAVPLYRSSL